MKMNHPLAFLVIQKTRLSIQAWVLLVLSGVVLEDERDGRLNP
jgi:hypothetical protein